MPKKSNKEIAAQNWRDWETWFKKATSTVALIGDPMSNSRYAWVYHAIKLIIYYIVFTFLFVTIHGEYPSFNKLTFIKLVIYEFIGQSMGLCCSAGPVGGQHPYHFPLLWHNFTLGTCRRPTFAFLRLFANKNNKNDTNNSKTSKQNCYGVSAVRGPLDILLFSLFMLLSIGLFIFSTETNIHHNNILKCIFLLLMYFYVFDRTIFLACRVEYYGMYLLCLYFENGWLQACQILQISVWIWAGVSKFGIWFDYVYPRMQAGAPTTGVACGFDTSKMPEYCKQFYKKFPNDLRPSKVASDRSKGGIILEVFAGVLMIFPITRVFGIICSVILHTFIILSCPFGAVQEWNVLNLSFSIYLYYYNGWNSNYMIFSEWNLINPVLQVIILAQCFLIPFICNLNVDLIDFLIGYRYYAGNWEQGIWIIKKSTLDNYIIPNLRSRNLASVVKDVKDADKFNDTVIGTRLIVTPTGKSFLNIFRRLFFNDEFIDNIGAKVNRDDYIMFDEYGMTSYLYGWSWHWNSTNMVILKNAIKHHMEEVNKGKKGRIEDIGKYDVMCCYIYSIPTLSWMYGKESSFHYDVYDFNHDLIDEGRFTTEFICSQPQFKDEMGKDGVSG